MKTEHRFAEALKSMMSELPLEEISVAALTRRCKVNRQTFYYHFHDIYDLLAEEFIYNTCYRCFTKFINLISDSKRISAPEKKNIVRFRAFAYSNSIVYYLSTHKSKSLSGLLACFCFENDENMRKEIIDLLDYRWRTNKS